MKGAPISSTQGPGSPVRFLLLLGLAALFRFPAWGEWNFGIDDQFYAFAGERLLAGDLLYVDIWDRKGPLLYLTFAAIAAVWKSMLAYQLVATLFAALGAWGVTGIARLFAPHRAAMLAGVVYLALLNRFEGGNLEAGVFFNTMIIGAAWAIATRLPVLRQGKVDAMLVAGFGCAGLAITIKQTTVFEGLAFGIFVIACLGRGGARPMAIIRAAALLLMAGAAPMLVTGLFYWNNGHFADLWNAMVTSNFARGYADSGIRLTRIATMAGMMAIPVLFAGLGLRAMVRGDADGHGLAALLALWAGVALAVLFAFPNIYVHYGQASLPPLAVLCAAYFAHNRPLWPALAALVGLSLVLSGTWHLPDRWKARPAARALADYVRAQTPDRRLLVWGAPSYLYTLTGARPQSPLAFAPHLYEGREWTGRDEVAEMRRILAARPQTVVAQTPLPSAPLRPETVAMVDAYLNHCARSRRFEVYDHKGQQVHTVFSGC